MEYKPEIDDKQEPDYKSLYIEALAELEDAQRLISATIKPAKLKSAATGIWNGCKHIELSQVAVKI